MESERTPRFWELARTVVWRGRSPAAVVADMIDGVVLVNGLAGPDAAACRQSLWAGLAPVGLAGGEEALGVPGGPGEVAEVIPLVQRPAVLPRAAAAG